jgi:hypothetical protein
LASALTLAAIKAARDRAGEAALFAGVVALAAPEASSFGANVGRA